MSKKNYYCVCRCTPKRGIVNIDAQVLNKLVDDEMARIKYTPDTRLRAARGVSLGQLCANAGFPLKALSVWDNTIDSIYLTDYEWVYRPINTRYGRFSDYVTEDGVVSLGCCMDKLLKKLGYQELGGNVRGLKELYKSLWYEKYYEAL